MLGQVFLRNSFQTHWRRTTYQTDMIYIHIYIHTYIYVYYIYIYIHTFIHAFSKLPYRSFECKISECFGDLGWLLKLVSTNYEDMYIQVELFEGWAPQASGMVAKEVRSINGFNPAIIDSFFPWHVICLQWELRKFYRIEGLLFPDTPNIQVYVSLLFPTVMAIFSHPFLMQRQLERIFLCIWE